MKSERGNPGFILHANQVRISTSVQEIVEANAERIVSLAEMWEQRRQGLVAKYRELKVANSSKMVSCM